MESAPRFLVSELKPSDADWQLHRGAMHEAGHAVYWVYAMEMGFFPAPFDHIWAHTTAADYDNHPERIAGALVPGDIPSSWSITRKAMLEARQQPDYDAAKWERAAVHEISECIAGPYAEARFHESGEPWWSDAAQDHLMDALSGDDSLGARNDMIQAAIVMKEFRAGRTDSRLMEEAAYEVTSLWDLPPMWACVTRIADLLRERGKLTYSEVATALGLAVPA